MGGEIILLKRVQVMFPEQQSIPMHDLETHLIINQYGLGQNLPLFLFRLPIPQFILKGR